MLEFDGQKLAALRQKRALSQAALAEACGVKTVDMVRRWENGEAQPTATTLIRLCVALECKAADMAGEIGQ